MAYELRLDGRPLDRFDSQEAALEEVRRLLAGSADREPEIIDLATGQPPATGTTHPDRDERAGEIGY